MHFDHLLSEAVRREHLNVGAILKDEAEQADIDGDAHPEQQAAVRLLFLLLGLTPGALPDIAG